MSCVVLPNQLEKMTQDGVHLAYLLGFQPNERIPVKGATRSPNQWQEIIGRLPIVHQCGTKGCGWEE
jgi:hypothetical protein